MTLDKALVCPACGALPTDQVNTPTRPTITEEAVEAAWRALHDTASRPSKDMARAALEAALPHIVGGDDA